MKHIIKVESLQNLPETRPLIAMDNNKKLFAEGQVAAPTIEMVDLGLSVKWAKYNIGATGADTVESWYGDYYAWGEIETKSDYSWSTYTRHTNGTYSSSNKKVFIKYIPTDKTEYWGGEGSPDNKLVLDTIDDVATQTYGSDYHMPTKAELEELLDTTKIDNVWIKNYDPTKSEHTPADDGGISGLNGRLFTSKIEGHVGAKIFIPAAGNFYGSTHGNAGSNCNLWSSSLDSDYPYLAWGLYFNSDYIYLNNNTRYYGFSVRAVKA